MLKRFLGPFKSVKLKLINIFNQLGSLKRYVTKINNNLHAGVVLIELLSPYLSLDSQRILKMNPLKNVHYFFFHEMKLHSKLFKL